MTMNNHEWWNTLFSQFYCLSPFLPLSNPLPHPRFFLPIMAEGEQRAITRQTHFVSIRQFFSQTTTYPHSTNQRSPTMWQCTDVRTSQWKQHTTASSSGPTCHVTNWNTKPTVYSLGCFSTASRISLGVYACVCHDAYAYIMTTVGWSSTDTCYRGLLYNLVCLILEQGVRYTFQQVCVFVGQTGLYVLLLSVCGCLACLSVCSKHRYLHWWERTERHWPNEVILISEASDKPFNEVLNSDKCMWV